MLVDAELRRGGRLPCQGLEFVGAGRLDGENDAVKRQVLDLFREEVKLDGPCDDEEPQGAGADEAGALVPEDMGREVFGIGVDPSDGNGARVVVLEGFDAHFVMSVGMIVRLFYGKQTYFKPLKASGNVARAHLFAKTRVEICASSHRRDGSGA